MGSSGPQSHSEQRKQLEPRLKREELEAQYNFDVFNRQVVGAGLWRSRSQEAVMDCDVFVTSVHLFGIEDVMMNSSSSTTGGQWSNVHCFPLEHTKLGWNPAPQKISQI